MQRRTLWKGLAALGFGALVMNRPPEADARERRATRARGGPKTFITTRDGTRLFFRDWGSGPPLVFTAPWGMNSNWWEYQIADLSARGVRCIAYDRRGHGRSDEPSQGYEFDTLADDLGELMDQLDLRDVTLVGHSMGSCEVVRYLSRHSARGVSRAVLVAVSTPFILKTADNPDGAEKSALEKGRAALASDRSKQIAAAAPAFFGVPPNTLSPQTLEWWVRMMVDQCSLQVELELHRPFTRTDFRAELRKILTPVLLIHGDHDVSAKLDFTSRRTAALLPNCELKVYENAAHGLPITHREQLNADVLAFVLSA